MLNYLCWEITLGFGREPLYSKGLGNSLCVVNGPVDYLYAVDALYRERDTSGDQAISLFDPELAIPWPISREQMIISERDKQSVNLAEKIQS